MQLPKDEGNTVEMNPIVSGSGQTPQDTPSIGVNFKVESLTLDNALKRIPMGPFHYRMLLLCGLAFMSDALEVNLLSYLSTCAGSDFNLSTTEQASVSSAVFAGIMVGATCFGVFANIYGRKMGFLVSCLIISVFGFLTAAAPDYGVLLLIRLLVGFGIGGYGISFDLLAEFMPVAQRGVFLTCIELFWTFGSMYVNGMAWALLDSSGWRVLTVVTAIPVALTSLLCVYYMPESPRWLLSKGRNEEAEKVLREAARANGTTLPPFRLVFEEEVHEKTDYMQLVANPAIRRITIPLWIVWAMFGFTYYGIILFTGRLYDSGGDDDGSDECSFDYSAMFINSTSELGGCIFGALIIDYMGRSNMQTVFYALAGTMSLFMGFGGISAGLLLALTVMGRMAVMCASNTTWVVTPELYNTELRTVGHSMCVIFSKMGSFICPFVVVSALSTEGVGSILLIANLIAALAAWMLPDTTGVPMGKLIEEENERVSMSKRVSTLQPQEAVL